MYVKIEAVGEGGRREEGWDERERGRGRGLRREQMGKRECETRIVSMCSQFVLGIVGRRDQDEKDEKTDERKKAEERKGRER